MPFSLNISWYHKRIFAFERLATFSNRQYQSKSSQWQLLDFNAKILSNYHKACTHSLLFHCFLVFFCLRVAELGIALVWIHFLGYVTEIHMSVELAKLCVAIPNQHILITLQDYAIKMSVNLLMFDVCFNSFIFEKKHSAKKGIPAFSRVVTLIVLQTQQTMDFFAEKIHHILVE